MPDTIDDFKIPPLSDWHACKACCEELERARRTAVPHTVLSKFCPHARVQVSVIGHMLMTHVCKNETEAANMARVYQAFLTQARPEAFREVAEKVVAAIIPGFQQGTRQ
jgi:hypothetical protein